MDFRTNELGMVIREFLLGQPQRNQKLLTENLARKNQTKRVMPETPSK